MSRFALIAIILVIVAGFVPGVSAETGSTNTEASTTESKTALLLEAVSVSDATSIDLMFNQTIRIDSIRVRIIDQATNESIKVASITGPSKDLTDSSSAVIHTATSLTAGASYVLTITSALSVSNMTIKAGVDSIREFTVPVNLAGTSLNAPPNPSAVIAATGSSTDPKPTVTPAATGSVVAVPQNAEALPEAGASSLVLILLAATSAFGLLLFRKKA